MVPLAKPPAAKPPAAPAIIAVVTVMLANTQPVMVPAVRMVTMIPTTGALTRVHAGNRGQTTISAMID